LNHVAATAQIKTEQISAKPAKISNTPTSHSIPHPSQQQIKNMHQPSLDREFSKILPTSRMFGGGLYSINEPEITSYKLYQECLPEIFKHLSSNKPITCLDIGSGIGLSALSLLAIFKETQLENPDLLINLMGGDISDWAISKAQQNEYAQTALESNWRPILRDLPEIHSHLKSDNPLIEELNKQRGILMKSVFKVILPKSSCPGIFELNTSILKENEKPSFIKINTTGDQIIDSSKNLIQCFGIFPNINQANSHNLLKTIANKLSPGGILFSDFPLVNDLQNYNPNNVLDSGLRVKNIPIHGINYQVLEKPQKS
jgi:hypothetical protein